MLEKELHLEEKPEGTTNLFYFILFLILETSDPKSSHLLPWNNLKHSWLPSNEKKFSTNLPIMSELLPLVIWGY